MHCREEESKGKKYNILNNVADKEDRWIGAFKDQRSPDEKMRDPG